mgnify:CR=1 FL=1
MAYTRMSRFSLVVMGRGLGANGAKPGDFAHDVSITAKVRETAYPVGVSVEGELGYLGSLETRKGEV